jgi:response regulator of citrate/malate metabolism
VELARQYGASAYLLKPLELEELDKVIYETAKMKFS